MTDLQLPSQLCRLILSLIAMAGAGRSPNPPNISGGTSPISQFQNSRPSSSQALQTTASYSMNAPSFSPAHSLPPQPSAGYPLAHTMSPIGETPPFSRAGSQADLERLASGPAIIIRNLTRSMTKEGLRSMFLFAKDFVDAEFLASDASGYFENNGHQAAIARFRSTGAAQEARGTLHGKSNTSDDATMVVEVVGAVPAHAGSRRNMSDGMVNGHSASTSSSASSNPMVAPRQASRYNGTFQNMERISPPGTGMGLSKVSHLTNGDPHFPAPDAGSQVRSFFSPHSPVSGQAIERPRVTGKSVINDDSIDDDETGELLKDPVAYARNGNTASSAPSHRRLHDSQNPVPGFGGLSLTTGHVPSPSTNAFASQRNPLHSPPGVNMTPVVPSSGMGLSGTYQMGASNFPRGHNYPPVNPADQNPPCNTLYVGNLPVDTSEDELKAMFSKQRGYKRLCFRTKQNGPMCFVEFEDVSFATKALSELYGYLLHNSVKGGIRLSFSKNPLGVRNGQPGHTIGGGMSSSAAVHGNMSGMNGLIANGPGSSIFGTATGPPPGLSAPPGLQSPMMVNGGQPNLGSPLNGAAMNHIYRGDGAPFGMHAGLHAGTMNRMNGGATGFHALRPSAASQGMSGMSTGSGGAYLYGVGNGTFPGYMMGT